MYVSYTRCVMIYDFLGYLIVGAFFKMTNSLPCFFCLLYMQMRRNMAKLELYRKFTNSLAVSVLLSIAWIGFEVLRYCFTTY